MHVLRVRSSFGKKKDALVSIGICEDCRLEDVMKSMEQALRLLPGESADLVVYKDGLLCAMSPALFIAAAKENEILEVGTTRAAPSKKQTSYTYAAGMFLLAACLSFAFYRPDNTTSLLYGFVLFGTCVYFSVRALLPLPKPITRKLMYQSQVKVEPVPDVQKVKDGRNKAALYSAAFTLAGMALIKIEGSFSRLANIIAVISFVQASILGYPAIATVYTMILALLARIAPPQVASKLRALGANVRV